MIDMPIPEKCKDCIFCDANCSCIASDFDGVGINVGCAWRTDRRDLRCPLKEFVLCKDCKHRPVIGNLYEYGDYMLDFPQDSKCPCRNGDDDYYSWYPDDDWFCPFGEREMTGK